MRAVTPPEDQAVTPLEHRGSRAAVVLTALVVTIAQAGGLVAIPLLDSGLIWPVDGILLAVALLVWRGRPRSALLPVGMFLAFWGALWVWMPHALSIAPDAKLAHRELLGLGQAVLLAVPALLVGVRGGPRGWRIGWVASLALTGSIALWELTTGHHLWVSAARPWRFPGTVAAATYINPNNFGVALLAMLVGILAWRESTPSRPARGALTAAAAAAALLVVVSQSRAALAGLVLVLALFVARRGGLTRARAFSAAHRAAVATTAAVLAVLLLASFLVPALAARNPLAQMAQAALRPETLASDSLRLQLIRQALVYASRSGFLGIGTGAFEPTLDADPRAQVALKTNLHNSFVELFTQYGWIVTAVFVALLVVVVAALVQAGPLARVCPEASIVRTEGLGYLLVFVAYGCTVSSALDQAVWWVMAAAATSAACRLRDLSHRELGTGPSPVTPLGPGY